MLRGGRHKGVVFVQDCLDTAGSQYYIPWQPARWVADDNLQK
jgi:hypothetical protein